MSSASDSKEIKGITDTLSIGQSPAARIAKRNGCGDLEKLVSHLIKSSPTAEIDKNRKTIAVFGPTGSGKSTLITACLGGKLRKDERNRIVNDGPSIAHIGHTNTSETLYPKIYSKQNNGADSKSDSELAFMDLPGSKDNRGIEILLANHINTRRYIKNANIGGAMVVIDFNSLTVNRGEAFRELALTMSKLLVDPRKIMKSLLFVVSKAELSQLEEALGIIKEEHDKLLRETQEITAKVDEDERTLKSMEDAGDAALLEQEIGTQKESLQEKEAQLLLLKIMSENSGNIIVGDLNSDETVQQTAQTINNFFLAADPIPSKQFNFDDRSDQQLLKFKETLFALVSDFSTNLKLALEGPAAIALKESELQSYKQTIEHNTKQIQFLQSNPDLESDKQTKLRHQQYLTDRMDENKKILDETRPQLIKTKEQLRQKRTKLSDINTGSYVEYYKESYIRDIKELWFPSIRWFSKEFSLDTKGIPFAHIEEVPKDKSDSPNPKWDPKKRIYDAKKGLYKAFYCTGYGENANATVKIYVNSKNLPQNSAHQDVLTREIKELEIREQGLEAVIKAKETENAESSTSLGQLFGLIKKDENKLKADIAAFEQTRSFANGKLPGLQNEVDFLRGKQAEVLAFIKKNKSFFDVLKQLILESGFQESEMMKIFLETLDLYRIKEPSLIVSMPQPKKSVGNELEREFAGADLATLQAAKQSCDTQRRRMQLEMERLQLESRRLDDRFKFIEGEISKKQSVANLSAQSPTTATQTGTNTAQSPMNQSPASAIQSGTNTAVSPVESILASPTASSSASSSTSQNVSSYTPYMKASSTPSSATSAVASIPKNMPFSPSSKSSTDSKEKESGNFRLSNSSTAQVAVAPNYQATASLNDKGDAKTSPSSSTNAQASVTPISTPTGSVKPIAQPTGSVKVTDNEKPSSSSSSTPSAAVKANPQTSNNNNGVELEVIQKTKAKVHVAV